MIFERLERRYDLLVRMLASSEEHMRKIGQVQRLLRLEHDAGTALAWPDAALHWPVFKRVNKRRKHKIGQRARRFRQQLVVELQHNLLNSPANMFSYLLKKLEFYTKGHETYSECSSSIKALENSAGHFFLFPKAIIHLIFRFSAGPQQSLALRAVNRFHSNNDEAEFVQHATRPYGPLHPEGTFRVSQIRNAAINGLTSKLKFFCRYSSAADIQSAARLDTVSDFIDDEFTFPNTDFIDDERNLPKYLPKISIQVLRRAGATFDSTSMTEWARYQETKRRQSEDRRRAQEDKRRRREDLMREKEDRRRRREDDRRRREDTRHARYFASENEKQEEEQEMQEAYAARAFDVEVAQQVAPMVLEEERTPKPEIFHEENSDLMWAVQQSRLEPHPPLPLSLDGYWPFRLTRRARSQEVDDVLKSAPFLEHCHRRVEEAGCEFKPSHANGARCLVPFTEQQHEELLQLGIKIDDHSIVALLSDKEAILKAFSLIRRRDRPRISDPITDR